MRSPWTSCKRRAPRPPVYLCVETMRAHPRWRGPVLEALLLLKDLFRECVRV